MADAPAPAENKGVSVKLILTLIIISVLLMWAFGIGIPDWLPFADYLQAGDWTGIKTLLLAAIITTPILVGYGAWLVYKAGDSKWPQRFFYGFMGLIFAVTASNMLLSTSAFDGLRLWLKAKRDHLVSPLTAVAEGHTPASVLTLKDFDLSGSILLWIGSIIIAVLLIVVLAKSKDGAKAVGAGLGKLVWPLTILAVVGGLIWAVSTGQINLSQPVEQTKASTVVTGPTVYWKGAIPLCGKGRWSNSISMPIGTLETAWRPEFLKKEILTADGWKSAGSGVAGSISAVHYCTTDRNLANLQMEVYKK